MGLFSKVFKRILGEKSQEDRSFEKQVREDGVEYVAKRIAEQLNQKISSEALAKVYILEELDSARGGNEFARIFVENSGFNPNEYIGAIGKTKWEGEESELEHLQLFSRQFLERIEDIDLKVKLAIAILDEVMQKWKMGKYGNNNKTSQSTLDQFDYNNEKVELLIEEYKDIIPPFIGGLGSFNNITRMNEFAEHMALAGLKGNYKGVVFSCFSQHSDILNSVLPIEIKEFSNESLEFMIKIMFKYSGSGFSKSFKEYLRNNNNKKEIIHLANNNPFAQFLMASWYSFDDIAEKGEEYCNKNAIEWFEKSGLNGCLEAMLQLAIYYDTKIPINLKKSAYWHRASALKGSALYAYNLSIMYSVGDGVSYNKSQATLWLSYAKKLLVDNIDNSKQISIEKIMGNAMLNNIKLDDSPNLLDDIELNPETAELNTLYKDLTTKSNNNLLISPDVMIIDELMWQKETVKMTWYDAMEYAKNLSLCGYDDWRVPTSDELVEVVHSCGGVINESNLFNDSYQSAYKEKGFSFMLFYWSSTSYPVNSNYAWDMGFMEGSQAGSPKHSNLYVRCVRNI